MSPSLIRKDTFFIGERRVGLGLLSVLSFLKSWPFPLDKQKKSMTLHKRSHENAWSSPSPLNPIWYYWSLLTSCLRIVTHCHNTVAKRWISLSLCHKSILHLWRSAPLLISIERKCFRVSCPNGNDSSGIDNGKCGCGRPRSAERIFSEIRLTWRVSIRKVGGSWGMLPRECWLWGPLNGWKCIRKFANLMFSYLK